MFRWRGDFSVALLSTNDEEDGGAAGSPSKRADIDARCCASRRPVAGAAIVRFSMRSLARSRQHRVVYAFFLAIAFAIAVSTLTRVATRATTRNR